ncbi:MAG: septum site-determining protein MinD [Firmicutes bacterium]|nr:septum site-determining protein MinD [Bacillota bacterium]
MARKIVITSGKGGVGKTTVVANLGASLARYGLKVALIDLDIGLNNLDVVLGMENKIVYDIIDVVEGRCRVRQALIQDDEIETLFVLPSARGIDKSDISGADIKEIVSKLDLAFDYIILDCPAGIDLGFHRAVGASEEAIVITTPHISAIRDADKTINLLKNYDLNSISLIVNKARGDMIVRGEMMQVQDIVKLLQTEIIGVIPDNDDISLFSALGETVYSTSFTGQIFDMLASNLHNGTRDLYDCTHRYRGFFGRFRRGLKRGL